MNKNTEIPKPLPKSHRKKPWHLRRPGHVNRNGPIVRGKSGIKDIETRTEWAKNLFNLNDVNDEKDEK